MFIRSRREFIRDTVRSVTALERGGRTGKVQKARDECAGRRQFELSGAGVHIPRGRQRRP